MKILTLVLMGITIAMYITDLIILHKYCTAGFWGYEDEWSSKRAEKAHSIIFTITLALCLLLAILGVILELKF